MPVPRITVIFSTISRARRTRPEAPARVVHRRLAGHGPVIDQRIKALAHLGAKAAIDRGHEIRFRLVGGVCGRGGILR
jgi:hypothetical protein